MSVRGYFRKIYRRLRPIISKGNNNKVDIKSKMIDFTIDINGNNNTVDISHSCILSNSNIFITGNENHLIIEDGVRIYGPFRIDMRDGSTVILRQNSRLRGVDMTANKRMIEYGANSMSSYNVVIRNTDSHKIYDVDSGEQINPPEDVVIGSNVWLAQNAIILKGTTIGNGSIVGAGAVVTKSCPENAIIAGNPAKIVKENVRWQR